MGIDNGYDNEYDYKYIENVCLYEDIWPIICVRIWHWIQLWFQTPVSGNRNGEFRTNGIYEQIWLYLIVKETRPSFMSKEQPKKKKTKRLFNIVCIIFMF